MRGTAAQVCPGLLWDPPPLHYTADFSLLIALVLKEWGTGDPRRGGVPVLQKCKLEVMHSTVRQKCIFILYTKPG